MTWKSAARSRSSSSARDARASSRVTNGSSRMIGGRRSPVTSRTRPIRAARYTDVERAPRQLGHRHPVLALRRVDLHGEVAVVDPDAPVAAARDPLEVGHHAPLEVARGELHRRLLGRVELRLRPLVDPLAAAEGGQALAVHRELLGEARDLLGVDRVLLHAGAGVGLVVAAAVQLPLGVDDLDLQPLSRARLLGDRPERLERRRLLLDLEGGVVPARRQGLDLLVADQARQVGPLLVDLGDVRLLEPQPILGLVELGRGRGAGGCRRAPPAPRAAPARAPSGRAGAGRPRRRASDWSAGAPRRSHQPTIASTSPIPATMPPTTMGNDADVRRRRRRRAGS